MRNRWWMLAAFFTVLLLRGTAGGQEPARIVIGSKNFTESRILGEIMAQLIEARTPIRVERRVNLGGTMVVFTSLLNGEIDLYPEYTGTGWAVLLKETEPVRDPLRAYTHVAREFEKRHDLHWLMPFGFTNRYELAMAESVAAELGVTRVSDLRPHTKKLRFGVTHEFLNRQDGWLPLVEHYDFDVPEVRGIEHGLAYEAVRTGVLDVIDTYTTDGKLLRYKIRLLEDDKNFFPPYDCAPVARGETLEKYPQLRTVLDELAWTLDDDEMRRLNYQVEEEGLTFEAAAAAFLASENLLEGSADRASMSTREASLFAFMWSQRARLGELTVQHILLTLGGVLLAVLFAVPLGLYLTRRERLAPGVLQAVGLIQTVPSLALLTFMIPLDEIGLGLGARSAVAALFLYALLPIVRNTYAGIHGVDRDLIEAARGMGLTDTQMLRRVELPLATRTIMAGIRTSTIISIGIATLAAFIGAGGLGDPIVTGLQLNDVNLILLGALPAAALALIADFLLSRVERALVPRGLS